MLKAIVDETSHGKYDFMYLRIGKLSNIGHWSLGVVDAEYMIEDFANNCKYVVFVYLITHSKACWPVALVLAMPLSILKM